MPPKNPALLIRQEIGEALASHRGVVALESTLVTHGLPWPENLQTAQAAEAAVRAAGSVPATIAVLRGRIHVGLDPDQLEQMAGSKDFRKAARRDLGNAMAQGADAATTVSATLWIARRAGLRVMATGGIGGVHLGAAKTFDVSADLDTLASADGTLVVCSGAKSILDLPATLEALETRGVAVVGYQTSHFPAFTTASSGLAIEHRVDTPADAAVLLRAHQELGLPGAILLVQETPAQQAIDQETALSVLREGLEAVKASGTTGKAVTPFLLEHLRIATGGRSLASNRALIVQNAFLAGQIAANDSVSEG